MFFKMLTAKETSQISVMRSIGFSMRDIQVQYTTRAVIAALLGIIAGTMAAGTLGQSMAALMIPGAKSLKFVVNPLIAYLLCPVCVIAAVVITLLFVVAAMKKTSGFIISAE
jgi:putative ABC transport system permease protein